MRKPFHALFLALLGCAATAADSSGTTTEFDGMQVEVRGSGRPVLMIPGLNSAGAVWDETCTALLAAKVQCHIVHLPGFAGQPALGEEPFLATQRDRLLRYVEARGLRQPVVMGHSLGGVLALMMARKDPEAMAQLVIVDALPFFPAAQNPQATAAAMLPMAEGMRAGMRKVEPEVYRQQLELQLTNMTRLADRMDTLKAWGHASDRNTTSQAMYEMFSTDLRGELDGVRTPTLVLGAWAGFEMYGATPDSIRKVYTDQYAKLAGVRIELSGRGYHFLMWDDPQWLVQQVEGVL